MVVMPEVVTHRYDPACGMWLNVCSLPDSEATQVLDRLRRESRTALKDNYLAQRRATEQWLINEASRILKRPVTRCPIYFFLGDFSFVHDISRPAAIVLPLASLPTDAITFTLGDSMRIVNEGNRRVFSLQEMVDLFADGDTAVTDLGFSDRGGFQASFVEVQVWDAVPTDVMIAFDRARDSLIPQA